MTEDGNRGCGGTADRWWPDSTSAKVVRVLIVRVWVAMPAATATGLLAGIALLSQPGY